MGRSKIQVNQPTSEILDTFPNLAVRIPEVISSMSILILLYHELNIFSYNRANAIARLVFRQFQAPLKALVSKLLRLGNSQTASVPPRSSNCGTPL